MDVYHGQVSAGITTQHNKNRSRSRNRNRNRNSRGHVHFIDNENNFHRCTFCVLFHVCVCVHVHFRVVFVCVCLCVCMFDLRVCMFGVVLWLLWCCVCFCPLGTATYYRNNGTLVTWIDGKVVNSGNYTTTEKIGW